MAETGYVPFTAPRALVDVPDYLPKKLNAARLDRHGHISKLFELVVHLSTAPYSVRNASILHRAWTCLCSSTEFELEPAWRLGMLVIEKTRSPDDDERDAWSRKASWVSYCREKRSERVAKFTEYVLCLAAADKPRDALDELETLLSSHPYNDSIHLNVLAGQLCLYLAQPINATAPSQSQNTSQRRRRRRRHSSTSSSSSQSSSDEETGEAPAATPRLDQPDIETLLRACELNDGQLFDRARGHFRHARDLEIEGDATFNEGARWFALLSSVSTGNSSETDDSSMDSG